MTTEGVDRCSFVRPAGFPSWKMPIPARGFVAFALCEALGMALAVFVAVDAWPADAIVGVPGRPALSVGQTSPQAYSFGSDASPTAEPNWRALLPCLWSANSTPVPAASPSPHPSPGTATPANGLAFDGERAMAHARAQCRLGPRPPGTSAHWQTGDYAAEVLSDAGWAVEFDAFVYRGVRLRNVIGRRGRGPVLMVAAHYDTRRWADREADPVRQKQPILGGNDGASGVAVLLELARVLDVVPSQREVWLVLFDAEDQGGIDGWEWFVGSTRLAERVAQGARLFDALILLDMVGDLDQRVCKAADSTPDLAEAILGVAQELGYGNWLRRDCVYWVSDDHTPFLTRGLAAVDLIDFDYPYWHTLEDTCDKIGAEELERVGRTVEAWIEAGAKR